MFDPNNVPPVDDDEPLARFILNSNEKRENGTVKPLLFVPYSLVALSVNRHRESSIDEIWAVGRSVAATRKKSLYGWADILTSSCRHELLDVIAKPQLPDNPNHADITGYPPEKDAQLLLGLSLAAAIIAKWEKPPVEIEDN